MMVLLPREVSAVNSMFPYSGTCSGCNLLFPPLAASWHQKPHIFPFKESPYTPSLTQEGWGRSEQEKKCVTAKKKEKKRKDTVHEVPLQTDRDWSWETDGDVRNICKSLHRNEVLIVICLKKNTPHFWCLQWPVDAKFHVKKSYHSWMCKVECNVTGNIFIHVEFILVYRRK